MPKVPEISMRTDHLLVPISSIWIWPGNQSVHKNHEDLNSIVEKTGDQSHDSGRLDHNESIQRAVIDRTEHSDMDTSVIRVCSELTEVKLNAMSFSRVSGVYSELHKDNIGAANGQNSGHQESMPKNVVTKNNISRTVVQVDRKIDSDSVSDFSRPSLRQ